MSESSYRGIAERLTGLLIERGKEMEKDRGMERDKGRRMGT